MSHVPFVARVLGYAGLIPFVGTTVLASHGDDLERHFPELRDVIRYEQYEGMYRHLLIAYGGCILSFMGAVYVP